METKLGPYALVRETGRGGMSIVHEAVDTRIGRTVAVKVLSLPPYLGEAQRDNLVSRLHREARAIARLSHPNIVQIFDVGEAEGQHFLVMEFLDGVSLRQRLDMGALTPDEAADVLDQVAAGLDAVHAQGVVHRDIKPGNVMLLPGGRVKLMDFGVARQVDDTTVTQAGTMIGSPAYMSPEQVRGEQGGEASDIWALGVLLYEMLAGSPPFAAPNIPSILYQVAHGEPAPLSIGGENVGQVVTRALEKNPAHRFSSARALAGAFRSAVFPAPALAPPPPPSLENIEKTREVPRFAVAYDTADTTGRPTPPRAPAPASVGRKSGAAVFPAPAAVAQEPRQARPRSRPARRSNARAAGLLLLLALAGGAGGLLLTRQPENPAPLPPVIASTPPAPAPSQPAAPIPAATPPRADRTVSPPGPRAARAVVTEKSPSPAPRAIVVDAGETPRQVRRRRPAPPPSPPRRVAAAPARVVEAETRPAATRRNDDALPKTATRPAVAGALVGTWSGRHTGSPATLSIGRQNNGVFSGTMSVGVSGGRVRLAVAGRIEEDGRVTLRETRVLRQPQPRSWDLGTNTGRLAPSGQLSGTGRDRRGRSYAWSFSR